MFDTIINWTQSLQCQTGTMYFWLITENVLIYRKENVFSITFRLVTYLFIVKFKLKIRIVNFWIFAKNSYTPPNACMSLIDDSPDGS